MMMATMALRSDGTDGPGLDPWLVDLYRTEYRRLVRLATVLVDDVGVAEELVQDAFVAVAGARERQALRDPSAAAAYLRTTVANRARSQLRKRRVRRRHLRSVAPPPSAPAADGPVLDADEAQRMLQALDRLPERQRQVLVLRYYGDLTEAEIAEALRISTGTVKTHAHRGIAALEEQMTLP